MILLLLTLLLPAGWRAPLFAATWVFATSMITPPAPRTFESDPPPSDHPAGS